MSAGPKKRTEPRTARHAAAAGLVASCRYWLRNLGSGRDIGHLLQGALEGGHGDALTSKLVASNRPSRLATSTKMERLQGSKEPAANLHEALRPCSAYAADPGESRTFLMSTGAPARGGRARGIGVTPTFSIPRPRPEAGAGSQGQVLTLEICARRGHGWPPTSSRLGRRGDGIRLTSCGRPPTVGIVDCQGRCQAPIRCVALIT